MSEKQVPESILQYMIRCLFYNLTTQKAAFFSKRKGPASVVEVKSPHSFVVDLDGTKYRLHANDIRHYNVRTDEVTYDNRAFAIENDSAAIAVNFTQAEGDDKFNNFCEMFEYSSDSHIKINTRVHDDNTDFGELQPCEFHTQGHDERAECEDHDLPSKRIDANSLSHLTQSFTSSSPYKMGLR